MNAEIINIGDEILIGQIVNTNSTWLAEKLESIGFKIRQITAISDDKSHIVEALDAAASKSNLVVITGGLGPTEDDITKQTLAEYFGTKLVENQEVLNDLKRFIEARNLTMNKLNIKQAELPESCTVVRNTIGTAAGMWFEKDETVFISMPGVPFEMKKMFEESFMPMLLSHFKTPEIVHFTVQTYGIPESNLAELIADWEKNLPKSVKLAYLPSPERLRLRLSTISTNVAETEQFMQSEYEKLRAIIGNAIYDVGDKYLHETIGDILREKNATLATAESCTGGNISRLITSVSGSSDYFKGAVVAYSNEIKMSVLGVKSETLQSFGAVSEQTVKEMAVGVMRLYETDYAISVSGIAGPNGATDGKPVGTTWIAVADKNGVRAERFVFGTQRDTNIRRASSKALDMLRKFILKLE